VESLSWSPYVSGLRQAGVGKAVMCVAWSPDGQQLATGNRDGTVQVWEVASGQELLALKAHRNSLWTVAWSPDGQRLATARWDGTAKVWDAALGQELLSLKGHTGHIRSLSWSPDGQRLATGSFDGTGVKVWQVADGRPPRTVQANTSRITALS